MSHKCGVQSWVGFACPVTPDQTGLDYHLLSAIVPDSWFCHLPARCMIKVLVRKPSSAARVVDQSDRNLRTPVLRQETLPIL